jgi:hypothetical protein
VKAPFGTAFINDLIEDTEDVEDVVGGDGILSERLPPTSSFTVVGEGRVGFLGPGSSNLDLLSLVSGPLVESVVKIVEFDDVEEEIEEGEEENVDDSFEGVVRGFCFEGDEFGI